MGTDSGGFLRAVSGLRAEQLATASRLGRAWAAMRYGDVSYAVLRDFSGVALCLSPEDRAYVLGVVAAAVCEHAAPAERDDKLRALHALGERLARLHEGAGELGRQTSS